MKRIWNYFASILVMGLLAGCSNDTLTGDDSNEILNSSKDAVYMNVSVQLPTGGIGSRSGTNTPANEDYVTSEAGTEIGKDYENEVKEILLVLAKKDGSFIAAGEALTSMQLKQQKNIVTTTQKISKTTLATYYGSDGKLSEAEQEIDVYVFCNPPKEFKDMIDQADNNADKKAWINAEGTIEEQPTSEQTSAFWGGSKHDEGFFMSNAVKARKKLPAALDDWKDYSSEGKAFNLSGTNNAHTDKVIENSGNIKVERSVARFDFKDGSKIGNNTYDVVSNDKGETIVQIKLNKMALVNMSKKFYYLRRVSNDGLTDNTEICGVETSENYVVDTDADAKNTGIDDYSLNFNFCLGDKSNNWLVNATARNQWFTSNIDEVIKGENDEYNNKEYHIWRYVSENTIPGQEKQTNGISTGIVFKGKMITTANATGSIAEALNKVEAAGKQSDPEGEFPILYTYLTNIYVTWKEVRAAAIEAGPNSNFYMAAFGEPTQAPIAEVSGTEPVKVVYSDDPNSPDYLWNQWHNVGKMESTAALLKFKEAATGEKFTLYEASLDEDDGWGYYCYYFYWNRHNDNGKPGEMGPMEFGVVRNNVYKLAVTEINRLGHPRISENDPDPLDPTDPDEKDDAYLTLSVEVLPWVVRVNNIEF